MMVRRGTCVCVMVVAIVLWTQRDVIRSSTWRAFLRQDATNSQYTTNRSQAFVLPIERWVEFPLPPNSMSLRIVTNATLDHMPAITPEGENRRQGWQYALDYELLAGTESVLDDGTYHFRTDVTRYIAPQSGELRTDKFFVPPTMIPCDSQTLVYDLRKFRESCRAVRLRVKPGHNELREIVVRVYYQQPRPNADKNFAWQRLSLDTRESLCRALVYPQEITTGYERQNLMRWQWNPSYPRGTEGTDYQHRFLYYADEVPGQIVGEDDEHPQNVVRPEMPLGMPIPAQGGVVQLEFTQLRGSLPANSSDVIVRGTWTGPRHDRRDLEWKIRDPSETHQLSLPPGVLQLMTDTPISIRPTWLPPQGVQVEEAVRELPTSRTVPSYVVAPHLPLEYTIAHVDARSTPIRISVRDSLVSDDGSAASGQPSTSIRYMAYDAHESVIASDTLSFEPKKSSMDRLDTQETDGRVSEAREFYFDLPPAVTKLRLEHQAGAPIVSAFTRPPHLPRKTEVPEDYQFDPLRDSNHRTWFLIQPRDYGERVQRGDVARLLMGIAPPDQVDERSDGEYTWESITPAMDWRGRELLIPRTSDMAVRDEALNNLYQPIPVNQEVRIRFVAPQLSATPTLRLLFRRATSEPTTLDITLDGQPFHTATLHASRGEISLPAINDDSPSKHVIVLRAQEPVEVYMRHVQCDGQPSFIKLLGQRFDGEPLKFVFHKQTPDEEVLRLQLFRKTSDNRCDVRVTIEELMNREHLVQIQPQSDWTIPERLFNVAATEATHVTVLGTVSEQVASAQTCFVHFGSDLSPGPYTVTVRGDAQASGYLIVYRLLPGRAPRHQISIEGPQLASAEFRDAESAPATSDALTVDK